MTLKFASISALAAALALVAPAAAPIAAQDLSNVESEFADKDRKKGWSTKVKRTERGHLIGNPDAETQLIEFVSYTCSHCADFAKTGEPALEVTAVSDGDIGFEVRPVIRNALDLTVSLLAACGSPEGFKGRHRDLMLSQSKWLDAAVKAPQSQKAVWFRGDKGGRINAASALDLDDQMVARGLTRTEITACLSDNVAAQKLLDNGQADATEFGIQGTPSFAMDGKLLDRVHAWPTLYPVLAARIEEQRARSGGE
ncbi:MAG: thioredoxin domain-containing protein [Pseudomonadota bacterium]